MSVVDVLTHARGDLDALAVVGPDTSLTRRRLDEAVSEAARRIPTEPGRVHPIVVDGTTVDTVVELLACWRAGVVPVPLNARLADAELARARDVLGRAGLPPGTQLVLWTSGTSGRPRGVALSFPNLLAITEASADRLSLGPDDVWLASLSPAHVGGLVLVVRALLLGSTLVTPGSVTTDRLVGWLEDGLPAGGGVVFPTHLSLVPVQLLRLLDERDDRRAPDSLRCVLIGGARASASLVERALGAGWPIALTYGCTEMSSQVATATPEEARRLPGTVGRPLRGVEVRVADDGELLVRGPTRALGYVSDGDGDSSLADEVAWYHTGDLGRIDADGRLTITGRRIDRIVSGGVTIDAIEVEDVIRTHPAVVDVCVVGVPDGTWGERVGALVVPVAGEYDPDELADYLAGRLMRAKQPTLWGVVSELPRNANGKVDRGAARATLTAGG